jgi:hypothetical protein
MRQIKTQGVAGVSHISGRQTNLHGHDVMVGHLLLIILLASRLMRGLTHLYLYPNKFSIR